MYKYKNKREKVSFFQKMKKAFKEVAVVLGVVAAYKEGIIIAIDAKAIVQQKIIAKATQDYLHMVALSEEEAIMALAKAKFGLFFIAVIILAFFTVMTKEVLRLVNIRRLELSEINKESNLRRKYYRDLNERYYYEYIIKNLKNNKNKKDR